MTNNDNVHHLRFKDKAITLVGTAHISEESIQLVKKVIHKERPDTVSVELCQSRYQTLTQKKNWQETDLIKVIKEKKVFLLLSNLILASFQKRIGERLGIKPGQEMMEAIETAEEAGAQIHLADRDVRITLSRVWRLMGFWRKLKLMAQLILSMGDMETIDKEEIEKMKKKDMIEALLSEIGQHLPEVHRILIDERDQYLAHKIRNAPGEKVVAVVGAGHVPGIKRYWERSVDLVKLEEIPPKTKAFSFLKWAIPLAVVGLLISGFFFAGSAAGTQMIKWWVAANAFFAGLGAAAALAHPFTIVTAILASPLTSLNPMMAAGWIAGLVELFLKKPKVRDFESLPEDILSFGGFWRNKITRILLVVVLTNVGSALGASVAIPLMVRVFA
jgi:pheromone shutdown-related protein TraB